MPYVDATAFNAVNFCGSQPRRPAAVV